MKEIYKIKSDRYNVEHCFVNLHNGYFKFETSEPWMTISISGKPNEEGFFFDPAYGPVMYKGWSNGEVKIKEITDDYLIVLEEC